MAGVQLYKQLKTEHCKLNKISFRMIFFKERQSFYEGLKIMLSSRVRSEHWKTPGSQLLKTLYQVLLFVTKWIFNHSKGPPLWNCGVSEKLYFFGKTKLLEFLINMRICIGKYVTEWLIDRQLPKTILNLVNDDVWPHVQNTKFWESCVFG